MKGFLCEIVLSCLLVAPGARAPDELVYGSVLFAHYQGEPAQALALVLAAERQGRLGDDPVRFALAKGSFAFEAGLFELARDTFAAVDPTELTRIDRMRLAFHSARERHRRGDWAGLEAQLAPLDGEASAHPEVAFLRAEAATARGDLAAASTALANLDEGEPLLAYGLFNLGTAARALGEADVAAAAFERLSGLRPTEPDGRDLVQRARLAQAVVAREQQRSLDAEALLGALPASGPYRDQALATYGALAADLGRHELAARIWLTLRQRETWSAGLAAAYLGLPRSLEQLDRPAAALARYRDAERAFEARRAVLENLIVRAREPGWALAVLAADPAQSARTPTDGGADWLVLWRAREDVHEMLSEWQELRTAREWLATLPPRLAAYGEVTQEQRRRGAEAYAALSTGALPARRRAVEDEVASLELRLHALGGQQARMTDDWMHALADPGESSLLRRLRELDDSRVATPSHRARIERLRGLAFWRIATDRGARTQALMRRVQQGRMALARIDARMLRIEHAESAFADGVQADFEGLSARVARSGQRVERALGEREHRIAESLQRALENDLAGVERRLIRARVGIARTTDDLAADAPASEVGR